MALGQCVQGRRPIQGAACKHHFTLWKKHRHCHWVLPLSDRVGRLHENKVRTWPSLNVARTLNRYDIDMFYWYHIDIISQSLGARVFLKWKTLPKYVAPFREKIEWPLDFGFIGWNCWWAVWDVLILSRLSSEEYNYSRWCSLRKTAWNRTLERDTFCLSIFGLLGTVQIHFIHSFTSLLSEMN